MASAFLGLRRKSKYVPSYGVAVNGGTSGFDGQMGASLPMTIDLNGGSPQGKKVVVTSSTTAIHTEESGERRRHKVRAVLLGQHPAKVKALIAIANQSDHLVILAGVSDLIDARVVLLSLTQVPDVFICGAYFETEAAQEIVDAVGSGLKLIKVPDGLMMEGGGPPAVLGYLREQVNEMFPEGGQVPL